MFTLVCLVSISCAQASRAGDTVLVEKLLSPVEISKKLRASLADVKPACVSVFGDGYSSAVIISRDGYVLTAGHVVRKVGVASLLTVTLENGAIYRAEKLGYNEEMDIGLIKIMNPNNDKFPVVKVAKTVTDLGGFVFTYAHPSGKKKGRPAQVRLGRVTSIQKVNGIASHLYSDLNIQPGDSGGPLFDLSGNLIGINSSAAGHIELNIFCCIDQYHLNRERLKNGEIFGDSAKSPEQGATLKSSFTKETINSVHHEIARRAKLGHYKSIDYYQSLKAHHKLLLIDSNELVNQFPKDSIFISQGVAVSMGLDDPEIITQLPDFKKVNFLSYKITNQEASPHGKMMTGSIRATAVGTDLLVAKASLYSQLHAPGIMSKKKRLRLEMIKESRELDLVLLRVHGGAELRAVIFPAELIMIEAGQVLVAPDTKGRRVWNVAMDQRRDVPEKELIGPMRDSSLISRHRGPYKKAIRHSLPLYAAEAGTPVFDIQGNFVGIHIARSTRTSAIIIPHEQIRAFIE